MGNSSPAPPKETGVISFDTLRYLHHEEIRTKGWRHSDMMEQEYTEDIRKALHELALDEKAHSTSLIEEVERQQWKLSNVDAKEFASILTQIMDRMEMNLQEENSRGLHLDAPSSQGRGNQKQGEWWQNHILNSRILLR